MFNQLWPLHKVLAEIQSVFWDGLCPLLKLHWNLRGLTGSSERARPLVSVPTDPDGLSSTPRGLFKLDCRNQEPPYPGSIFLQGNPSHSTPPHSGPQWGSAITPEFCVGSWPLQTPISPPSGVGESLSYSLFCLFPT